MEINHALEYLNNLLKNHEWFFDLEHVNDKNVIIVYTHWINNDVFKEVPENIDKYRVLLHYASSKLCERSDFVYQENLLQDNNLSFTLLNDSSFLIKELSRLEKICGSNILENIFFEIKDQNNAVTNLSVKFPEIRKDMDKLYKDYGFNAIYKLLDN